MEPTVVKSNEWTLREFRRAARTAAGLDTRDSAPVCVVEGDAPPTLEGMSYCWRTPGGTIVRHPAAFARRRWPTVYHRSTRRVVVGAGWRP